jgi:hypothetical protein
MTMSNTDGHTGLARQAEYIASVITVVAVDNIVGTMLTQDLLEATGKGNWPPVIGALKHSRFQCMDLIGVGKYMFWAHRKIYLEAFAVNAA